MRQEAYNNGAKHELDPRFREFQTPFGPRPRASDERHAQDRRKRPCTAPHGGIASRQGCPQGGASARLVPVLGKTQPEKGPRGRHENESASHTDKTRRNAEKADGQKGEQGKGSSGMG